MALYLGGRSRRGRYGISHYIGKTDLPNQLSPEDVEARLAAHKNGCNESREILITTHIRLVLQISAEYASRYQYKREDIVSAAMLGLVEAVDRIRGKDNNNISGYITMYVHSYIYSFLAKDRLIYIPKDKLKEMKEEHLVPYNIPLSVRKQSDDEENSEYANDGDATVLPPHHDDQYKLEISDFLNQLNARESKVIDLRLQGYTDSEVGESLGVSGEYVSQIRMKIGNDFVLWSRRVANDTGCIGTRS